MVEQLRRSATRLTSGQSVVLLLVPDSERGRVEGLAILASLSALVRGLDNFAAGEGAEDHARAIAMSTVLKCMAVDSVRRQDVFEGVVQRLVHACCHLEGVADHRDLRATDSPEVGYGEGRG